MKQKHIALFVSLLFFYSSILLGQEHPQDVLSQPTYSAVPVAENAAAENAAAVKTEETVKIGPTTEQLNKLSEQTAEESEKLGPANKEFLTLYKTKWVPLLQELARLKLEYQTANKERSREIDKVYAEKVEQGSSIQKELTVFAKRAFEETPYKNPYVLNYLFGLIGWDASRENYEAVVDLFKMIEKYGIPENMESLYAVAGTSAFKSMNFDEADKWLNIATKAIVPGSKKSYLELYFDSLEEDDMTPRLLQQFPALKRNWEKEVEIRKKQEAETDPEKQLPLVVISTNKGDITIELFEDDAPNTVANFISLIEKGFYKNVPFHRVLGTFMAQGGDPTGTGAGGPGYSFDCECRQPNARKHFRGSISMANAGPDTNGSQFFLMFTPNISLDGRHTVFGRVVDGIEVLSDIQRIDPEKENQPAPDKIVSAKVLRKRNHNYEPVKNANPRR